MRLRPFALILAVLVGPAVVSAADEKPIRALLVLGGCCHDYQAQKTILSEGISARGPIEVVVAYDPDTTTKHLNPIYENENWAKGFDVIIHDECSADVKDKAVIERILKPHRQGLPAVVLHCGFHSYRSEGWPKATPWFEFTGGASTAHGPQVPIKLTITDQDNPITKGLSDWTTIREELYNNSAGKLHDTAHALIGGEQKIRSRSGKENTAQSIVAWTNVYNGKARVFSTSLGHNNDTVGDPRYLDLVTRGLLWSVNKLDDQHFKSASAHERGDKSRVDAGASNTERGPQPTLAPPQAP
jgi:type 1 glutamine amidotransferase